MNDDWYEQRAIDTEEWHATKPLEAARYTQNVLMRVSRVVDQLALNRQLVESARAIIQNAITLAKSQSEHDADAFIEQMMNFLDASCEA